VNDILREAAERLRGAGIDCPRADARLLWEHAQQIAQTELSHPPLEGGSKREALRGGVNFRKQNPSPKNSSPASGAGSNFSTLPQGEGTVRGYFESFVCRRLAHEPVAYIVGHKEFWSLDFEVGAGALIPRPETETLIEHALRELPDRTHPYRILDLGTGSGCLLMSLLREFPNATSVGIDSSDAALSWAKRNVARHGLGERCELSNLDWAEVDGHFDLIVSNPPYIPTADIAGLQPDVRDFEPKEALDGGPDGLAAYRAIAPVLKRNLRVHGLALLEIGAGQHQMVEKIMGTEGLPTRTKPDLAGIPRCMVVRGVGREPVILAQKMVGNPAATR
jgi:release factor glutamine methyltransferase